MLNNHITILSFEAILTLPELHRNLLKIKLCSKLQNMQLDQLRISYRYKGANWKLSSLLANHK